MYRSWTTAQIATVELLRKAPIEITFWGSEVFSRSVPCNVRSLDALVRLGDVTRKSISFNSVRYTLNE